MHREIELGRSLPPLTVIEGTALANEAGAVLWDAGIVLIGHLTHEEDAGEPGTGVSRGGRPTTRRAELAGKAVIELGSGTGAVGLAAAALGAATVTLTDLAHLLPLLRENVAANAALLTTSGGRDRVHVAALAWGDVVDAVCSGASEPRFDVVLASDVLYEAAAVQPFLATLRALSGPHTLTLLAIEHRAGLPFPAHAFSAAGFAAEVVPQSALDPRWRSDDISVFRIRLQRPQGSGGSTELVSEVAPELAGAEGAGGWGCEVYDAGSGSAAYEAGGYEAGVHVAEHYEARVDTAGSGLEDQQAAHAHQQQHYQEEHYQLGQHHKAQPGDQAQPEAAAHSSAAELATPASQLAALEAQVRVLNEQRKAAQAQLVQAATAAYQAASAKLGPASTGVALPAELPLLVEELSVLQVGGLLQQLPAALVPSWRRRMSGAQDPVFAAVWAARQYLAYLQELRALARHVEKAARMADKAAGEDASAALVESASEATNYFSQAMGYVLALQQLSAGGRVPADTLQAYGGSLAARVEAAQGQLHALLSAAIQQRLAAAQWPPPLAASEVDGGVAAPASDAASWPGWDAAPGGEAALVELQQLCIALLTLQRSVQHAQFAALAEAPSQEGPVLGVAEELAAPLEARLRHHFAEGLPTDRADKPEWLFATVQRAARQLAPHAQALQPAVEAHQLDGWYSMPLEVARAVQTAALAPVLRSHVLPRLVAAGDPALWLHYADEAIAFERSFTPLRGSTARLPDEEEFLSAAHPHSAVELLFSSPDWEQGWLEAEHWDAARQLEAACDAYTAWQPATLALGALGTGGDDLLPETPRSRWAGVASLVGGLVRRGGWVYGREHRLKFMRAEPLAVLHAFREKLSSTLQTGEQFRDMLGEVWLPKVSAAVCAAHYLEHHLREPQGVLLLAELQDATPGSAGGAAADSGPGLAALIEREAAAFGSLRKQWAYKLAKQAADAFHALFAPYRRNLAAFSAGHEEEAQGAEPEAPGTSRVMLEAADRLQALLRALACHLDAVAFLDIWRAVALAVNYSLYNDVATEALFSRQGALQLGVDVDAAVAVFGEHTSRPAAHFKETKEACRLLALPLSQAADLVSLLTAARSSAPRRLLGATASAQAVASALSTGDSTAAATALAKADATGDGTALANAFSSAIAAGNGDAVANAAAVASAHGANTGAISQALAQALSQAAAASPAPSAPATQSLVPLITTLGAVQSAGVQAVQADVCTQLTQLVVGTASGGDAASAGRLIAAAFVQGSTCAKALADGLAAAQQAGTLSCDRLTAAVAAAFTTARAASQEAAFVGGVAASPALVAALRACLTAGQLVWGTTYAPLAGAAGVQNVDAASPSPAPAAVVQSVPAAPTTTPALVILNGVPTAPAAPTAPTTPTIPSTPATPATPATPGSASATAQAAAAAQAQGTASATAAASAQATAAPAAPAPAAPTPAADVQGVPVATSPATPAPATPTAPATASASSESTAVATPDGAATATRTSADASNGGSASATGAGVAQAGSGTTAVSAAQADASA
eukprot:scaffold6.g2654.t1